MKGTLLEEPIAEVIARTSNAEEIFEDFGIDYWFGCDQTLEHACAQLDADPQKVAALLHAKPSPQEAPRLPQLLAEIDSHFETAIAPAVARVRKETARIGEPSVHDVTSTLDAISAMLASHMEIYRGHVLTAVRRPGAPVEQKLVRELARQHAVLAIRANELVAATKPLGDPALTASVRAVVREIHHHLRVAYNGIMPELFVLAAMRRPSGIEPW